ncbi:cytochrome C oxidase subunit IV family protein [Marinimicrobium alkaliphilum]|uniref:cytochrome C oxidase subunit IV family protein n=1 Tax=Marinimicrobium alkaliphilum TaxID=2202654 RepID=UPI000DB9A4A5|nr:cytochrome C oxidase subunit IV family protein [Marinimicrobium alkaliphilum]
MSESGQHHPSIGLFIKVWILLFVLSFFSYLVEYYHLEGMLRWSLIILFMILKAAVIVAVFMHFMWERLSLQLSLVLPPLALLVLVAILAIEGNYTYVTRLMFFTQ